jgi:hypothetical protein
LDGFLDAQEPLAIAPSSAESYAIMARRTAPEPPKQPSVSKPEGRHRLMKLIERGEALLAQRPLKEGQEDI